MASPPISPVYNDLLQFLVERASPDQILAYRVSPEIQVRADELLQRLKTEELTPEESEELGQMREFDLMVRALKAKALAALKKRT
jgi:hypothetical protein